METIYIAAYIFLINSKQINAKLFSFFRLRDKDKHNNRFWQ